MNGTGEWIRGPAGPLRLDGPCGAPIVLSSPRAVALGDELGGWRRATTGPITLFEDLATSLPVADTLIRTPSVAERVWSPGPRVRERVFLPPNVDGLVAAWAREEEGDSVPLRLEWSVPDVTGWRLSLTRLAVRDTGGGRRLFCVQPPPEWDVAPDPARSRALRVQATVPWASGHEVRLTVLSRTAPATRRQGLRALGFLGAEQTRAETALERARLEELSLETPDVPGDQVGFRWACARLSPPWRDTAAVAGPEPAGSVGALLAGLGALSLGYFEEVRRMEKLTPAVLGSLLTDWAGAGAGSRADAPAGIEDILAGRPPSAAQLARITKRASPQGEPVGALSGAGPYAPWLEAWAAFDAGDAEAGYQAFRALVERGRKGGWSWGLEGGEPADPALAGLVPATVVFGMLGARAEASYGRLRLAPAFPGAWRSARVRNLRIGASRVTVSYARDGAVHTFGLEQMQGAVPVNLVFEPRVPGSAVRGAAVDEQPAELDSTRVGDRVGVRLQLPLDRKRTVVVRTRA